MFTLPRSAARKMRAQLSWKSPFNICYSVLSGFEQTFRFCWLIITNRRSTTLSHSQCWMVVTVSRILPSLSLINKDDVISSTTCSLDAIRYHLHMVSSRKNCMNDFALDNLGNLSKSFITGIVHLIK